ncbi:MAG: TraB/GumN family protein [Gammaproteobacteria bacterium]|nr:TraB/GumN family protein [Gammaproteobacteria bacterium]
MPDPEIDEPIIKTSYLGHQVCLLGTAHVSKASADKVKELLSTGEFDIVAIELCPNRYDSLVNPDNLANMDLFKVIREGKTSMVMASLALGAYQQRLAEEFGIEPGAEMRMAIEQAKHFNTELELVDRDIGVTLKRVYASVPWWKKILLATGLMASVVSKEEVSEDEIERLKDGDILETTFSQFAEDEKDLFRPLIDERDQYMALQIANILSNQTLDKGSNLLAVVGAGHLNGINRYLNEYIQQQKQSQQLQEEIQQLEVIPKKNQFLKYFPWLIVALVFTGFFLGFQKSSDLGWQMVFDWVIINGGLSALGALLAGAHPLTILSAFVAAPLTSLNPTIGAGMVTAAVEAWLRKPSVGDFSRLRHDTTSLKGWWHNKVSRTLLVFFFSTLGSAVGTYVAGFRIFESLI